MLLRKDVHDNLIWTRISPYLEVLGTSILDVQKTSEKRRYLASRSAPSGDQNWTCENDLTKTSFQRVFAQWDVRPMGWRHVTGK